MVLWVGSPKCAALGAAFVPDVEGCVLWLLLKSSTSRLLNFIPSPHSALTELLNLPLQVINYPLKSGCPIKESIKTPDTCIIYDLHWNPPKLLPLHPRAIFFTIIFPFLSSSWPQAELPCALGGLLCIITPRTTHHGPSCGWRNQPALETIACEWTLLSYMFPEGGLHHLPCS